MLRVLTPFDHVRSWAFTSPLHDFSGPFETVFSSLLKHDSFDSPSLTHSLTHSLMTYRLWEVWRPLQRPPRRNVPGWTLRSWSCSCWARSSPHWHRNGRVFWGAFAFVWEWWKASKCWPLQLFGMWFGGRKIPGALEPSWGVGWKELEELGVLFLSTLEG